MKQFPSQYGGCKAGLQGHSSQPSLGSGPDDSPFLGVCPQGSPATVLRVPSWICTPHQGCPSLSHTTHRPRALSLENPDAIPGELWIAQEVGQKPADGGSSSTSTRNDWDAFGQTAKSQKAKDMEELPHPEGCTQARNCAGISQTAPSPIRAQATSDFVTLMSHGLAEQLSILTAHSSHNPAESILQVRKRGLADLSETTGLSGGVWKAVLPPP